MAIKTVKAAKPAKTKVTKVTKATASVTAPEAEKPAKVQKAAEPLKLAVGFFKMIFKGRSVVGRICGVFGDDAHVRFWNRGEPGNVMFVKAADITKAEEISIDQCANLSLNPNYYRTENRREAKAKAAKAKAGGK